jgi:hypothetical protein
VLATSLLDETAFPTHLFKDLYHLRWGIEEQYKRAKCRVEIENFSGRTAQSVRQDFYAKIFAMNLTAILVWVAQAIADRLYAARRHAYRVNFANALARRCPVAHGPRGPGTPQHPGLGNRGLRRGGATRSLGTAQHEAGQTSGLPPQLQALPVRGLNLMALPWN